MSRSPSPRRAWRRLPLSVLGAALCTSCSGDAGGGTAASGTGDTSVGATSSDTAASSSATSATTAGSASASGSSAGSTATGGASTGGGSGDPKFDVGAALDLGPTPCDGMGGDIEFSYIWIANSSEGTISKINTQTMVEEGRYLVHPQGPTGNPSRTSVNLSGDVAVANRSGGITKVYARPEDCVDDNGTPGIQTSTGPNDVLAWDMEECVAWHTPIVAESNRPIAWAPGTMLDPQTCTYLDEKVWTSASDPSTPGSLKVYRLAGSDGQILDTVPVPNIELGSWGAYGGAVDGDGSFWFITHGTANPNASLTKVDAQTLQVQTWPTPAALSPYGFTVDSKGRPWVAGYTGSVSRFDPMTETWAETPGQRGFGIQEDAVGRMWVAANYDNAALAIDTETMQVVDMVSLPSGIQKGMSIDFFGNVWVVYQYGDAYRIDPDAKTYDVYSGLVGAYTYSDMTGWGLKNVAFPPG